MNCSVAACFALNSNIMIRCFRYLHSQMDRAIAACFSSNDFKDASSEGFEQPSAVQHSGKPAALLCCLFTWKAMQVFPRTWEPSMLHACKPCIEKDDTFSMQEDT
jgi:hypothetical protein